MADRLAASTNTYHGHGLEDALDGIARAGFASVELSSVPGWTEHVRRDAGAAEIERVKGLLDGHGLTPVSLSGHSDLVSDDGVSAFRKALRLCTAFGVSLVTTSTGGHDDASAGALDEQRDRFLARIGPLADEAAAAGIAICLETHGGLLATGAMAAKLIGRIGKPNVGVNYDPGNVVYYGDTAPEADIGAALPLIRHLHVKDQIGGVGVWNFPIVGTGEIPYPALFAQLDAAGFAGPCSIEVEFTGGDPPPLSEVDRAMAESYAYVRRFVPAPE